jgi:glycosyltransferase involved in cell wall biosynthesis
MTGQKLIIHRATLQDADLIADLGHRTFQASFSADNRPEDMEQYLSLNFSKAHIEVIPFHDNPMFNIAIPVKLFEAMWAKCAIVSSDLESIKQFDDNFIEFITPGNVDELSSKLIHLLNNPEDIATRGETGAKLVKQKYNWKSVEYTLLDAYKDFKD